SNIGINSSSQWSDYGKLSIDEDQLKSALQTDAESVKELFVGEKGLTTRLNKICDKAASTSSGSPGSLVSLAGVVGKGTEKDNTIQDQLDSIAKKLESLNLVYEKRKERYWNQFNAMESALANMDSQSSWLTNMMG
ncbi:MAG: flagellar filament capping protein FliD, partial [Oscillospiraceae bacterium]|nr:flagellar filament capping protein FliD [Oscillospiraceae bacterium]